MKFELEAVIWLHLFWETYAFYFKFVLSSTCTINLLVHLLKSVFSWLMPTVQYDCPSCNAYLKDMTMLNEWERRGEMKLRYQCLFWPHMETVSLLELLSIGNSWWRTKAGCSRCGDGIVFLFSSFILQPYQVIVKWNCRKIQHIFLSFSDVRHDCIVHICLWPS